MRIHQYISLLVETTSEQMFPVIRYGSCVSLFLMCAGVGPGSLAVSHGDGDTVVVRSSFPL